MNSKLKTEMLDFRLVKPYKSNVVKSCLPIFKLWERWIDFLIGILASQHCPIGALLYLT